MRTESSDRIQSASGLSNDQREKLIELRTRVSSALDPLSQQSLKLRAVLINDVIADPYNEEEVSIVKNRLRKVSEQRLTVIFDAVTQANRILGRQAAASRGVVEDLFPGRENRE